MCIDSLLVPQRGRDDVSPPRSCHRLTHRRRAGTTCSRCSRRSEFLELRALSDHRPARGQGSRLAEPNRHIESGVLPARRGDLDGGRRPRRASPSRSAASAARAWSACRSSSAPGSRPAGSWSRSPARRSAWTPPRCSARRAANDRAPAAALPLRAGVHDARWPRAPRATGSTRPSSGWRAGSHLPRPHRARRRSRSPTRRMAVMLGVRRATVTEAAGALQRAGAHPLPPRRRLHRRPRRGWKPRRASATDRAGGVRPPARGTRRMSAVDGDRAGRRRRGMVRHAGAADAGARRLQVSRPSDGEAGLRLIERSQPAIDVVLTDLRHAGHRRIRHGRGAGPRTARTCRSPACRVSPAIPPWRAS